MMKLVPNHVMRDNQGFGKFRGGHGYQQIATVKDSAMWGFMVCAIGSKFPSAHGVFGGYSPGSYPLCKIKGVNVFEVMEENRDRLRFTIEDLMNDRPFPDATYSTHHMGLQFEVANTGELYMISQGAGGGYGDVLERDPQMVADDLRDGLISLWTAENIYRVVVDEQTLTVDVEATQLARDAERRNRLQRGMSYDDFVAQWQTPKPPEKVPFFGSWDDPALIYRGSPDDTCPADAIAPVMMPDPKDVRIAALEARLAELER